MKKLFEPSLEGVAEVMMDQLKMAQLRGREINVRGKLYTLNSQPRLTFQTESHSYGRLWPIRCFIEALKEGSAGWWA